MPEREIPDRFQADIFADLHHLYRDAANEPACMADQVAEHNRLVDFYKTENGKADAKKGYEYWREQDELNHSPYTLRMVNLAGGLAGLFDPWMALVGHITITDSVRVSHPNDPPEPTDWQQIANPPPEIDRINRALSDRQEDEAAELIFQQQSQTHGDEAPWQQELYPKQCVALEIKFAEERDRYNAEYQDAQRIRVEILEKEKEQEMEQGKGKGFSK
jgi:hypothetical protein